MEKLHFSTVIMRQEDLGSYAGENICGHSVFMPGSHL